MANSVDPDQTAPIGAVCSGSMLYASIFLLVMLGNYLQQTTSADNNFRLPNYLLFHFLHFLCVFVEDMLAYKLGTFELLTTYGT